MHGNRRMQTARRLPSPIAHTAHKLAVRAGRLQWQPASVARQGIALRQHASHAHLQTLHGRIHITRGSASARFLAQNIPGLNGLSKFNRYAIADPPVYREPELEMR